METTSEFQKVCEERKAQQSIVDRRFDEISKIAKELLERKREARYMPIPTDFTDEIPKSAEPQLKVKTLVLNRARGHRNESALYFWLSRVLDTNPPDEEVEKELHNLLTRGYAPGRY